MLGRVEIMYVVYDPEYRKHSTKVIQYSGAVLWRMDTVIYLWKYLGRLIYFNNNPHRSCEIGRGYLLVLVLVVLVATRTGISLLSTGSIPDTGALCEVSNTTDISCLRAPHCSSRAFDAS